MSECSTPQSLCSSSPPISLTPYSSLSFVFSLLSLPFFLPLFPSQFPLFSSGLSCPFPSLLPSVLPSGLTSVPEDLVLAEGATEREGKKQTRGPEPVSEKLERSGGCTFPSTSCLCVSPFALPWFPPQRLLCDLVASGFPQLCRLPGGTEAFHCLWADGDEE